VYDSDLEPLSHIAALLEEPARVSAPQAGSLPSAVPRAIQESHNFLAQSHEEARAFRPHFDGFSA